MALAIVRDDITRIHVDAIVNSTNEKLTPGGSGVDAAIHYAAGPELLKALSEIGTCKTGAAVATQSYGISSCQFIIHTVGPVYKDGKHGERKLLKKCYQSILSLARKLNCRSLAIPSISSGAYGFPKSKAYHIATSTIRKFLFELPEEEDMMIYLVLFDQESVAIGHRVDGEVKESISDSYHDEKKAALGRLFERRGNRSDYQGTSMPLPSLTIGSLSGGIAGGVIPPTAKDVESYSDQDLSFAEMCDWWCEKKKITKKRFYTDANINKAMFWNMKHHPEQVPKKTNVLACAIGLKLDYAQTQDLLMRAGMTLSRYYELDRIVEGYIRNRIFDIDIINGELFDRDLGLLGTF